jgi:prephenate dehydrogenase
VSSPQTVEAALKIGAIDEAQPLQRAVAISDLIYLSQPIERILETIEVIDAHVRPGTVITDAGSTKRAIVDKAGQWIRRGIFVGGHPMAGKEVSGVQQAEASLFHGRPYVLTSRHPELETWVVSIGARLVFLDAEEHDRLVALTSHLPQLISTSLANLIGSDPAAAKVAGPAALDLTRLAASPYEIWRDILRTNATSIDAALGAFIWQLQQIRASLAGPEMEREFEAAAKSARQLRTPSA